MNEEFQVHSMFLTFIVFLLNFQLHQCQPDRDLISLSYHEAIEAFDFPSAAHSFSVDAQFSRIRNFSIAALAAIKLSQKTRNFDHPFNDDHLPHELCPLKKYRCSVGKYRHSDGRCTNLWRPLSGSIMAPFSRRIPAIYDDDISTPHLHSHRHPHHPLPPVELITKSIAENPSLPQPLPISSIFLDFAAFVYDDLAKLVKMHDSMTCCDRLSNPNPNSDECFIYKERSLDCHSRSAPAPYKRCSFGRREQMNLATSFLDIGSIYHENQEIKNAKISPASPISTNPISQIFIDEHNWVVDQLKAHYPFLRTETIFEEARKFVIAEYQSIIYRDFLPLLIGDETMKKYNLIKGMLNCRKGSCNEENVEANTLNEFATVVGKFFKFMLDPNQKSIGLTNSDGIIVKPSLQISPHLTGSFKSDLVEILLNSRDHGIATYTQWRKECGGGKIENYRQLIDTVDRKTIDLIASLFSDVRDVDLLLLGLAENPVFGSIVGPTFGCIIALQFHKAKYSDSFWFETNLESNHLQEVEKTSMSSLLCRHQRRIKIQANTFLASDEFNNIPIYCNLSFFSSPDLSNWIVSSELNGNIETGFDEILGSCIQEVNDARNRQRRASIQNGFLHSSALQSYGRMMLAKDEAVVEANISFILLEATRKLINEKDQHPTQIQGINIGTDFGNKGSSFDTCNPKPLPCDPTNPYRSYTGWCNNLEHPSWANTFTELRRLLPPHYDDGINRPRSKSINGSPLPSPREISNKVHFSKSIEHSKYSHLLMEFGQFIDHDITHSPVDQNSDGTALNCSRCDSTDSISPSCYPIPVPNDDQVFEPRTCLSFVRSLPAQKTLGYRNQMNQISAYLDGSVMYGSTKCEGDRLRTFQDGKLKITRIENSRRSHLGLTLPQSDESEQDGCVSSPQSPCFIAGDDRNSQQTLLIAVHSIFHREHDRITTILKQINNHWDDERLYQETRRIVTAQFSHIVYSQYLPHILGQNQIDRYDLRPLKNGYFNDYESCDASILQPFATAAFRFGHSTVRRFTSMIDGSTTTRRQSFSRVIDLASEFLNMSKIYQEDSVEMILDGLHGRRQMATDRHVDDAVRNFLFSNRGQLGTGLDLIAINIQRGRDHAIPPYNQYRLLCGLESLSSFLTIFSDIDQADLEALAKVYESPDDIDLFTGIVSEKLMPGAIVGPTAACLIGRQFQQLKKCDRFYYENGNEFTRFSEDQLTEIRKISLSSLICANTKIAQISKDPFSIPDQYLNAPLDCQIFDQIDFTKWREDEDCNYQSIIIKKHSTLIISPCTSCTCTSSGLKCVSIKPDCKTISREEFEKDSLCLLQCANYYSK